MSNELEHTSNGSLSGKDEATGRFVEGNDFGKGRELGSKNLKTLYREAIAKIALLENKTPEELEQEITATGIKEALKGNYSFYKDYMDRNHGTVVQRSENVNLNFKQELPPEDKKKLDELIK